MKTILKQIYQQAQEAITKVHSSDELEAVRVQFLGRRSELSQLIKNVQALPKEEKKSIGQLFNKVKIDIQALLEEKKLVIQSQSSETAQYDIDVTLPGFPFSAGSRHPLLQITNDICQVFKQIGFEIIEGWEIETERYNFTGLNIPLDHPSRDAFDTFYLDLDPDQSCRYLLRSHTSPMQVRVMEKKKPPLAVVVPGRVYRPDKVDATHSFMFHQIEGFMVDVDIRFSHVKGVLSLFAKRIFGQDIEMRFRPHFFPFTEPSVEVDISCFMCRDSAGRSTCKVCGGKGWLEILGAGMIHPNVFKAVGYPEDVYTGFAFGMGIERIAMLKYGIDDIRLFFENDMRFLEQFI